MQGPPRVLSLLAVATFAAGCVTSTTSSFPGESSSSSAAPGYFSDAIAWSFPDPAPQSKPWDNPFPKAGLSLAGSVGPGRFQLEVEDADGEVVYALALIGPTSVSEQATTAAGTPGSWSITLTRGTLQGAVSYELWSTP